MKINKFLILTILIIHLSLGCYPRIFSKSSNPKENKTSSTNILSIMANNLSEDVNILSTQNDELILLAFSKLNREFPENILEVEFIMDSIGVIKQFKFTQKLKPDDDIIIVLIEMDTKQSSKQIEPIVRLNLETILNAFIMEDNTAIKELLGDDDLLSINKFTFKNLENKD